MTLGSFYVTQQKGEIVHAHLNPVREWLGLPSNTTTLFPPLWTRFPPPASSTTHDSKTDSSELQRRFGLQEFP